MTNWATTLVAAGAILAATAGARAAETITGDPLQSNSWEDIRAVHLGAGAVVYDTSLEAAMPKTVENAHEVPIMIRFTPDIGVIEEIVIIVEHNPIQVVARMRPYRPIQSIGLNMRLETSSPVRAAARTADGVWHVASRFVDVLSAGGCSTPPPGAGAGAMGEIAVKTFDRGRGISRMKFRIAHPMSTGLATGADGELIPAHYIERIAVADDGGRIADLTTWAAMSMDPTIIIDMPQARQNVRVNARDSEGLEFESFLAPSSM
jgi:sulfur-oxidizing protein SoxY